MSKGETLRYYDDAGSKFPDSTIMSIDDSGRSARRTEFSFDETMICKLIL